MMLQSTILSPSLSLSLSLCMSATAMASAPALDDHEFAHPEGEDSFGQTYRTDPVPTEMWEILDENGEYVVPSFIDRTIHRGEQECWVFEHTPAGGAVHSCPQTFEVQLRYTCNGNDEYIARLPITLIDIDPPVIDAGLVSGDTPHISFGGIPRYPASAAVLPVIDIQEPCGLSVEYVLNGDPYTPGTPITGTGLYFLNIIAEDSSENVAAETLVFEVRERPSYTAATVVEETDCTIDNGVLTSIDVRLLIAAEQFTPDEILRSSLRMILRAPDGSFLAMQPMEMNVVELNDCWVAVDVASMAQYTYEHTECPSEVYVLGVGVIDSQITFEWGAVAPNVADPNALDTLAGMVGIDPIECDDPVPPSDPAPCEDPPRPCEGIENFILFPQWPCAFAVPGVPGGFPAWCGPAAGSSSSTWASTAVGGGSRSTATAVQPAGVCSAGPTQCVSSGGALVLVFYVGDCCECATTFQGGGTVTARARAGALPGALPPPNFPTFVGLFDLSARAAGFLRFDSPCDLVLSTASATVNYSTNPTWNVPAQKSVTVTGQSESLVTGLFGPMNCVVAGCDTKWMTVTTNAFVRTHATVWAPPAFHVGTGHANSGLASFVTNISGTGTGTCSNSCESCPCEITVQYTLTFVGDPEISGSFFFTYTLQKADYMPCLYEVIDVATSHTIECCGGTVACNVTIFESASGAVWWSWSSQTWLIEMSGPVWSIGMPGGPVLPCHNYTLLGAGFSDSLDPTQCPSGCVEYDDGWIQTIACVE